LKCNNGYVKPTIKRHAGPPLDQPAYTRFDKSSNPGLGGGDRECRGQRFVCTACNILLEALAQGSTLAKIRLLKPVIDADLLLLDDLFLSRRIAPECADQLQSIVHQRYKLRRSNLITSNRIIADWDKYLGDAAQATTILDRLMHRSVLVEFRGKSYRLKEAASRPSCKGRPPRVTIHPGLSSPVEEFDPATGGGISSGHRGARCVEVGVDGEALCALRAGAATRSRGKTCYVFVYSAGKRNAASDASY
jgi:hypothetical protein